VLDFLFAPYGVMTVCYAYNKPAYSPRAKKDHEEEQGTSAEGESSEAWSMHASLDGNAKETELGVEEGSASKADEWYRGNGVHTGSGAQSSGALGGTDSWRPSKGPWRSQVSYIEGNA